MVVMFRSAPTPSLLMVHPKQGVGGRGVLGSELCGVFSYQIVHLVMGLLSRWNYTTCHYGGGWVG